MRIVQGELPIQRYAGADRSIGPQYVRGISHWADDGSRASDKAMWLAYSMNKEDIWVSRVPLPVKPDAAGADEPWNVYCPKWARVQLENDGSVRIEDRDPHDYVRATRMFPQTRRLTARFTIEIVQATRASFEIELMSGVGSKRPVRLIFGYEGKVHVIDGTRAVTVGSCDGREPVAVEIDADASTGKYSLTLDRKRVLSGASFAEPADSLARISFRTGAYRGIGGKHPVAAGSDRPAEPIIVIVCEVHLPCAV
jgi:hypothetical protein